MIYTIIFLLVMNTVNTIQESNRSATSLNKLERRKPFAALVFTDTNNFYTSTDRSSCQWLNRLKHQSKMCKKRRGLPEALLHAKELAVKNCQEQFEFDQWNCSKRELLFKKIYRETAFMYSIASSAVMFSVAKACSLGSLAGCKCGAHGKQKNSTWQWGGCADNSKYAKKITRKFLQLQKKGDTFNAIVKYNAEVGIKVVMANEEIACRCHGVSGSCSVRICWKRIRPFDVISKQLKALYHSAIQVQPRNNIGSFGNGKSSRKLLFLENRLDFCPSTVNRRCKNKENCATLCCGRNTYNETKQVSYRCDCSWRVKGEYNLRCRSCPKNVTVFRCT